MVEPIEEVLMAVVRSLCAWKHAFFHEIEWVIIFLDLSDAQYTIPKHAVIMEVLI